MKVRRLVVAFAALIAGPAAWLAGAEPAHAGGPTSVLLSNPGSGRVGALYHTSPDYQRLVDLLDAYGPLEGQTLRPGAVHDGTSDAYRLTWMIHDMNVWRIDQLYETGDGVWVKTMVDPTGDGSPLAHEGRWNQLRGSDEAVLSAVFGKAGVLEGSPATNAEAAMPEPADPSPEVATGATSTTAGPGAGVVAAGAGLAGLVIGVGGTWALRRARATVRRPGTALSG
jgi:hypothetical protein